MSYILDALRRADAERERDPARGIHAQPAAGAPARERTRFPAWAWPVAAGLIVLVGGFALWPREAPRSAPAASAAAIAPASPSPGLVKLPAPAAVVVPVATVVSPPAPAPLPAPVVERPVAKAAMAAAPASAAATSAASASTTAMVAAPAPAPAADRVYAFAELPADVQRELPKLAITGGVHSENAAQRLLIVGGQVMSEGAELAPGVLLEQIRPRSAVLKFRGWRYSVSY